MAEHPGARPKRRNPSMATSLRIPRDGAEITARIARLEDRFRSELMNPDERCELRDRIIRLKKKAGAR